MNKDINSRMEKAIQVFTANLQKIRTGRAHIGLLDTVTATCYGVDTPLSQLATVTVADNRTLVVNVWDQNNTEAIEKAIRDSDLGVNPAAAGQSIRVTVPTLSEERRRDLAKLVGKEAEDARIAIRNIRRDAIAGAKSEVKEKTIGEDEGKRMEQDIQKNTDAMMTRIESITADKQKELMTA